MIRGLNAPPYHRLSSHRSENRGVQVRDLKTGAPLDYRPKSDWRCLHPDRAAGYERGAHLGRQAALTVTSVDVEGATAMSARGRGRFAKGLKMP
jgi:hypothetical protein